MKNIRIFIPLLILYLFLTILFSNNFLFGDEFSYVQYATNLSKGYYADKNLTILFGPGYPLILSLFIILKAPLIIPKLLNCIFLIGGVIYLFNIISFYITKKSAIIISYVIGIFPVIIINLLRLMSESLAFFLVSGFIYTLIKYYNIETKNWRYLILASVFLSYLALTRTIFSYVILVSLIVLILFYFFKKYILVKKTIFVLIFSIIFCSPYLIYTYSITGKIFYWSTNAGDSIYWLSTTYESELGDWYSAPDVYNTGIINEGHRIFYQKIDSLDAVQKEELFRAKAIKNIYTHPIKFIKNWTANIGRLFFNYPFTYDIFNNSYDRQKTTTYFYMFPNMFLIVFLIISFYPAIISRKIISQQILIISLLGFIYLAGSTFASAFVRYFVEAIPFVVLWLVYIYSQIVKIEIKR